ncbi:hypothetical protein SprV_0401507800 [Sparganum proliferum]
MRQRSREKQDACMDSKAEKIQRYAEHNAKKAFFASAKTAYDHTAKWIAQLLSFYKTKLLTEKAQTQRAGTIERSGAAYVLPPSSVL